MMRVVSGFVREQVWWHRRRCVGRGSTAAAVVVAVLRQRCVLLRRLPQACSYGAVHSPAPPPTPAPALDGREVGAHLCIGQHQLALQRRQVWPFLRGGERWAGCRLVCTVRPSAGWRRAWQASDSRRSLLLACTLAAVTSTALRAPSRPPLPPSLLPAGQRHPKHPPCPALPRLPTFSTATPSSWSSRPSGVTKKLRRHTLTATSGG